MAKLNNELNNQIIGKWELFDTINAPNQFNLNNKQNVSKDPPFKEIYFLPNGQKYWIFEGWEQNKLFVHYGGDDPVLCFDFSIKSISGTNYMFLNVVDYNNHSFVMVLQQVSNKTYTLLEIGKRENVNLPFVLDPNVIGKWNSVAFVSLISDFNGKEDNNNLWLKSITFKKDGTATREYFDETWEDKWTKGKLLDNKKLVASSYTFKIINNKTYMFLEWKMGNYVYGGMPAEYYVFVKEN